MVPSVLPTMLLLSSAAALRVTVPRATIRMGLSSGAQFPQDALDKFGVAGKKAVLFFYGADDAPSCSKQIKSFGESLSKFEAAGVEVVGIRNEAGVKGGDSPVNLVVDDGDKVRKQIDIKADMFGMIGGRETYVVDEAGKIAMVHNAQLDTDSHINNALDAVNKL